MSTQHPDNVSPPFFVDQPIIQGEAEVREANLRHLPPIAREEARAARDLFPCDPDEAHAETAKSIMAALRHDEQGTILAERIARAGTYRRFLG